MTSQWRYRREDVVAWPDDPEAREALGKYLDAMSAEPEVQPIFGAALMDLRGADLRGLDLSEAYLFNTVLVGVNLSGAYLVKATLNGADLRHADLTGAKLTKAEAYQCRADGAIFRNADLFAVEFYYARLVEGDFRGATMTSIRFLGADLTGADLRGAKLVDARFGDEEAPAVLSGARLSGADVRTAWGSVVGPIDVGGDEPSLVDGEEMISWFAAQGAPRVALAHR
ncbi:MAG: pentapeptide repeat-containing protein [Micromonosporaceae bacterium]|nr:pentapeptide repeat-containing protein [Micromonosporaceae bacterium]